MRISDWSSDVCSSDLSGNLYALGLVSLPLALLLWAAIRFSPLLAMLATIAVVVFLSLVTGIGLGGFTRPLTLLEIGRASCRERGCQYVEISVVAVSLKKKQITKCILNNHHNQS